MEQNFEGKLDIKSKLTDFLNENRLKIFTLIAIIILIMSIRENGAQRYFFLIIFGGALGNLYDRIFFKAVPDFLDLHVGNFHWFIFNIADIFITFGVIMLILCEVLPLNKSYEKK